MQEGTVNLFFVYYAESYPHSGGGVSGYPPPDVFWRLYKSIGLRLFKLFDFSN